MVATVPWLSIVTFTPLLGALAILVVPRGTEEEVARQSRWGALWVSLMTFLVSLVVWIKFDTHTPDFQFVEQVEWLPAFGISYHLGIDGISLFFVLLRSEEHTSELQSLMRISY